MKRHIFFFDLLSSNVDASKQGTNIALLMPIKITKPAVNLTHSTFILNCCYCCFITSDSVAEIKLFVTDLKRFGLLAQDLAVWNQ